MCVGVCVCGCMSERELCVGVCVCGCMSERKREFVCVCVCMCVRTSVHTRTMK